MFKATTFDGREFLFDGLNAPCPDDFYGYYDYGPYGIAPALAHYIIEEFDPNGNRIFIDSKTNPKIETSYDYEKINSETLAALKDGEPVIINKTFHGIVSKGDGENRIGEESQ